MGPPSDDDFGVQYKSKALFGEALSCDLPSSLVDASEMRQIPDTQEVFVFNESDQSVIFEVLELVKEGLDVKGKSKVVNEEDLESAITTHFIAIAQSNEATKADILAIGRSSPSSFSPSTSSSISISPSSPSRSTSSSTAASLPSPTKNPVVLGPVFLMGFQEVSKFNKPVSEADSVLILLALWRIPSKNTDLTLCINQPYPSASSSSSSSSTQLTATPSVSSHSEIDDSTKMLDVPVIGLQKRKAVRNFQKATQTFHIKDFGLFAG